MADDGINSLNILLIYGNKKLKAKVILPEEESGHMLTVKHLADAAAEQTEVPVENQRLIFKGKSLSEPSACLSTLGMKEGSKVMLIGKKFNPEDDGHMEKLKALTDDINRTEKKLNDVTYEIDGIYRGYLAKDLQHQGLSKLDKRLKTVTEELTQYLERLDAMMLNDSATEVRSNRKSIVKRVQALLDRCDEIQKSLCEMIIKSSQQ